MAMPKEWYTVSEAAEYLAISRRTVYKLCNEGRLAAYTLRENRSRRFRKKDLDRVPQLLTHGFRDSLREGLDHLSYRTDPELAELWDNEYDAEYDDL